MAAAAILSFNSITKPQIQILMCFSALPNNNESTPPSLPPRPLIIKPNNSNNKLPKQNYKKLKQEQQPSVMEIERAIGAGIFRDRDDIDSEEKRSVFENVMRNTVGEKEGPVEKKLRETGEWLLHQSENTSRAAGKQILVTMFVWVIPLWIFGFLIAAGILQLPFTNPFLQDLLS